MTVFNDVIKFIAELDQKYEKWETLPSDHPDIKKLQYLANTVHNEKVSPLRDRKNSAWQEEEDQYVLAYYNKFTTEEIGNTIGRTPNAVRIRYKMLKKD